MKQAAVCMSTYNGEKYIRQQLDSILGQNGIRLSLYIRDDGSGDGTVDIIEEYCAKYPNVIFINKDHIKNVGVKHSFLNLIKYVVLHNNDINYFAFADQDDVWKEDKIKRAVDQLEKLPPCKQGRLYYSNKTIVDQELKLLYEEKITYYGDYFECLFTSLAFGCTMVFDRQLAELICRHRPRVKCYHDSWIYRLAKTIDSGIIFDADSYILYRQHGKNQAGIGEKKTIGYYIRVLKIVLTNKEHFLTRQLAEIVEAYPDLVRESEHYDTVNCLLNYRRNIRNTIRLLRTDGVSKRPFVVRLSWYYKVLFGFI